jgi:hypothetical protein
MHNKLTLTLTGIGMLGAAALLAGCGGSSLSTENLATRPDTLPYIYGLEPIAYYGAANSIGAQAAFEGSGFQAASGGQAFITGDTAFTVLTGGSATLPVVADPNSTKSLPTVFSTKGLYADGQNQIGTAFATVTAVPAGTSVYFRAAIANGLAASAASPITGATLTSTDSQLASVPGLTAGLPMSLDVVGGAFSNATYVTGTGGTATPFTIPAATTAGLHTVVATVTDSAGRVTSTTFIFPVVTPSTVCLFAQNITADGQTAAKPVVTPIGAGDAVTIDGAAGTGTYPAGYTPTKADPQGTVVFFVAPGTHTLVDVHQVPAVPASGTTPAVPATTVTTTQTLTIPATNADGTVVTTVIQ